MKLSILTPAVPSRLLAVVRLVGELQRQIGDLPVEHLVLIDNKRRTVGEKRDALLRAARGDYVAYVDDDDTVTPHYVSEILRATDSQPDVVTFEQEAHVNGLKSHVIFGLRNPNEAFHRRHHAPKRMAYMRMAADAGHLLPLPAEQLRRGLGIRRAALRHRQDQRSRSEDPPLLPAQQRDD